MKALAALVLVIAAACLAAGVEQGFACSCALPDARSALASADGAFVGTARARREAGQQVVYTFAVERALKGSLGQTVEVVTPSSSASCGIEVPIGARVGLVLDRRDGAWNGSLCAQFEPAELLAAASPLPAPNGRGPATLVLGGEFGDTRLIALDARGRTLAYGRGGGRAGLVSFCPGNRRLTEVAFAAGGTVLAVRALPSLRVVRRHAFVLPGNRYPERLACEASSGTSSVVFARGPTGAATGAALYRMRDGRRATLWRGAALDAGFSPSWAYLSAGPAGRTLLRVDLASGRTRRVASLPGAITGLSVSADGTGVAGIRARVGRPSEVSRVDLRRPGGVAIAPLARDAAGQVFWLRGGRLLFAPAYGGAPARVLDTALRTTSRFRWAASTSALAGDALFGADQSLALLRAVLPAGPQRVVRQLPGRPTVVVAAR